ncbi:tetratricopeptide repeat protein [Campylobacterota bacterium DY0563]
MIKMIIALLLCFSFLYTKESKSMSKKSYKILIESQKLIEQNKNKEAKSKLLNLLKNSLNGYEKSFVLQTLANIAINSNNYTNAIKYYKEIIQLKALEPKTLDSMKLSLGKIYLSKSNYKLSIKTLKPLLKSSFVNQAEVNESLAYASFYNKDYINSISYIKKSIKNEKKESYYQILYSSYIELKNYKESINTLKQMVTIWHKNENYWLQLVALYQETKNHKKALSTFELAYKRGGVNIEKNSLYFVNVLIQNQLYLKAAQTLEKAIDKGYLVNNKKNFELLVSCYNYAKQKNKVKHLLTNSDFGKDAKYQLLLANIHFNEQEYDKSIRTLKKLNTKRASKEEGQKFTLLALSFNELEDKKETKKYLQKAINNPYEKNRALNIKKSLQI